ncbi:MAG TPA: hypothetical protein VKT78_15830 [Fimbriimonadaceae bacterium]|nr:hypothetical protein [Fimbriimonadaceae bacterium]
MAIPRAAKGCLAVAALGLAGLVGLNAYLHFKYREGRYLAMTSATRIASCLSKGDLRQAGVDDILDPEAGAVLEKQFSSGSDHVNITAVFVTCQVTGIPCIVTLHDERRPQRSADLYFSGRFCHFALPIRGRQ